GVAYRTALESRRATARRRAKEASVHPRVEAATVDGGEDLRELLDRTLAGLPDRYREVVVLCDLEGKGRKEVARELGCPDGTVASRLARARALLAKRLRREGLALPASALVAALTATAAPAALPPPLVSTTIRAAGLLAAGHAATAGVVPAQVAALMEGVLKTM